MSADVGQLLTERPFPPEVNTALWREAMTPGLGRPALDAAPGTYYVGYGDKRGYRVEVVARARAGWWVGALGCFHRHPRGRARLAHLARMVTIYDAGTSNPRSAVRYYCGTATPHGAWAPDHGQLEPCLSCVGRFEQAHLRGFPCHRPCDYGCFGALDPRCAEAA